MILHTPQPALRDVVDVMWLRPGADPMPTDGHELALPTGTVELVINLDADRIAVSGAAATTRRVLNGPVICGVHSEPFVIDPAQRGRTLGIHFKPGGAFSVLPLALHALHNVHVELADVIGGEARRLRDALDGTRGPPAALFAIAEQFLLARRTRDLHPLVQHGVSAFEGACAPSVRELVQRSGYSHRRFNELFRTQSGLGAKRYSRVARFQRALALAGAAAVVDWQDVVYQCGFADQAHLVHEFSRHAGMSPTTYLELRGERPNHPTKPAHNWD